MDKDNQDPHKLDFTKPRLCHTSISGEDTKIRCIGSIYSLFNGKDLKFYHTRCNAIILYDTYPAYCIPKVVRMETGEIICEKVMCHLDHHRKFPTHIIRCAIWILILLEAAKIPNEFYQNQKPNYQKTVRPVKVEEHDILSHADVKEAEHFSVQEVVKKDRKSLSSRSTSCRVAAE